MRHLPLAALALGLGACGSAATPQQKCESLVATLCAKAFQCGAGAAYGTEAACRTKLAQQIDCASWTLPDGCTYDWAPFDRCLADVQAQSCADAAAGKLPASCQGAALSAPACPGSVVRCSDSSSTGSGDGCSKVRRGCTDGRTYVFTCQAGACTCQVDGIDAPASGVTDCPDDDAVLNQACGWKLYARPRPPDLGVVDQTMAPPDLTYGCVVGGTYYAPDAPDPLTSCRSCQPAMSTSQFSRLADGVACGGGCGACRSGRCEPVVLADLGANAANGVAVDATLAYYTTSNGTVMKVPLAGGNPAQVAAGQVGPWGVAVDGVSVYWTSNATVMKAPRAGGNPVQLASGQNGGRGIALDAANVYWTNAGGGTVMKVPKAGGPAVSLASGQASAWGIAVDGSAVYFTTYRQSGGTVMKVPLGGGGPVQLAGNLTSPWGIAVDGSHVYWTNDDGFAGTVSKVPLGGGAVDVLAGQRINPMALALDAGVLYWTERQNGGAVRKMPVGGGNPDDVATNLNSPGAVTVDAKCVYWGSISRVMKAPK